MQAFHHEYDVFVGRDMGGNEYTISPGLVARYVDGTGDGNDWYAGPSSFGAAVAPALLLHSEVYRNLAWYLPNLIGNLHARQEWELFQPMLVGEAVRTRSTVVERYVKRNREYVVNEVLVSDAGGRLLQRSRTHQSFLLDPSSPAAVAGGKGGEGYVVDKERERRADRTFVVGAGEGPELEPAAHTITHAMCEAFSGPHKSYHTDREMARALGFPDIVVQGMMSVCFVSEVMTRNFGAGWFCGGKLDVRLVNVVWPGDRLVIRGRVREEVSEGPRTRIHCDVWCAKEDGVTTVVGSASALR